MVAIASLNVRTSGRGFPRDVNAVLEQWGESLRNSARFVDAVDHLLARYETPCPESMHFPCDEELERHGVDLQRLATVLHCNAVSGAEVGALFADLKAGRIDAEQFDDALCAKLLPRNHNLCAEDAATAAYHLPDVIQAALVHPDDLLDQALHLKGEEFCSCGVEYHEHGHGIVA